MELDQNYLEKLKKPLEGKLSLRPSEYVKELETLGIDVADERHYIDEKFEKHFVYLVNQGVLENGSRSGEISDFGFIIGSDGWTSLSDDKQIPIAKESDIRFSISMPKDYAKDNPSQVTILSKHHLAYSIIGLLLSTICILGGIYLFINGISGSTSWTAKILGAESNISDAAPGSVLFIVGLFFALVTRYKFSITNE